MPCQYPNDTVAVFTTARKIKLANYNNVYHNAVVIICSICDARPT